MVEIRRNVLEDLIAHAREEHPNECCGLLIGSGLTIERSVRTANLARSPTRYLVDPAEHFAAIRSARADGLRVVGVYHSHPGAPPVPSREDLAKAYYPEFVYLIASIGEGDEPADVRVYRLAGGCPVQLELAVVSGRMALRR